MITGETHVQDMAELLADWQLEDLAWSVSIKLMRVAHDDFATFVQSIAEEYACA